MEHWRKLVEEVSVWPQVSVHPHRFGGKEFRFGSAEVGHVHTSGMVDIPLPCPVRDALLDEGLAEEHHWVPDSGWVSFRIRGDQDLEHAVWLLRLSLLRYRLKAATDPGKLLDQESDELSLSPRFRSLFRPFLGKPPNQVSAAPLSA